jgi:soluble lytic murein transglycosylase
MTPTRGGSSSRLLARKLLDTNAAPKAYRIVRDAASPTKEDFRVEHEFTADWIALRFLKDPATATEHFARIIGDIQPDRPGAGWLLARPCRRRDEQAAGGTRPSRAGGPLQHGLLRPARARQAERQARIDGVAGGDGP